MSIQKCFHVAKYFLNDDNRLCREDWGYVDDVVRGDGLHATESPSISLPVVNSLGHHKICLQTTLPYQKWVQPKTRRPSSTPKGETEPKVWILCNNQYIV